MASITTTQTIVWTIYHCSECSVPMALPQEFRNARLADRKAFYCLNGHNQFFPGKTHEQEAKEAKAALERIRVSKKAVEDQLAAANRSNSALRGSMTKIRKRIGNGSCPCCNRHFKDVERHMANKHPDFKEG
jgi:hypothetical protein